MTAVIGILNKTAVAIAADSAVTVSSTGDSRRKVYNTANKIFKLSKHHPIGIVIYNSASFIKTPWETIVKMYRNHITNKAFDSVGEYRESLITYVKSQNAFYSNFAQRSCIRQLVSKLVKDVLDDTDDKLPADIDTLSEADQIKALLVSIKEVVTQNIDICRKHPSTTGEFDDFTLYELKTLINCEVEKWIDSEFADFSDSSLNDLFLEYLYEYLKSDLLFGSNYSGLVFTGFGEKDIYPQCVAVEVAEIVNGRLRYSLKVKAEISDEKTSAILPFAQRDVIDTVIYGVAPDLKRVYTGTFLDLLKKYNDSLIEVFEQAGLKPIADIIRGADTLQYANRFNEIIRDYQLKEYEIPTRFTTALLSKEDLAEMAESLIYLTYLKRRFTSQEESVGGPVDVAVISKGDGFVWIKRKYYFKPELNPHFFHTYFSESE
ncbi:hypothetical protein ACFSUS_22595 [Spirosoma soli]|uniref:Uncharacterized protein n=1 Tax=Spirosoma soli TaxID=1770529 RepID=A0ABW5M8X6_9BACT